MDQSQITLTIGLTYCPTVGDPTLHKPHRAWLNWILGDFKVLRCTHKYTTWYEVYGYTSPAYLWCQPRRRAGPQCSPAPASVVTMLLTLGRYCGCESSSLTICYVCVCAPSLPPESHFQYPDFGSTLIIGPQSLETCWRLNHPEASWSHLLTQPLISGTTGKAPLSWRRRHPSPDHLAQGQGSRALKPRKDRCGGDAERKKETWRRGALYRAVFFIHDTY